MTKRGRDPRLRVLLAQLSPVDGDPEANVARLAEALGSAAGAELAVFPELYLTGYSAGTKAAMGRRLDDPLVTRVREAAAAAGSAVITGFAELGEDGRLYNSALCVDRDGSLAGVHRKAYLFGPQERGSFAAGDQLDVVNLAGRRVAPLICFEVEFPEPARLVAGAGVDLLVTIAANMAPCRHDHDLASRARALDNRLPHVYVNRVGREPGLDFVGGSQVIDAAGRLLGSAGAAAELLVRSVPVGVSPPPDLDYLALLREPLGVREGGRAIP